MYTLDILNRLNDINADKDIKSLSHAVFPGTHCPLFGVILTASYIKNMALVVVGTSECTYYAKNFAYHRQEGLDSVYSVAIKESDVVFSAEKKVKQAIKQIIEFENPDAIMVVSTCVPEVIGEDYSSLSYSLEDEVDIPVFVVNTDHFTCNAHIPGMSRSLAVLSTAMKKFKEAFEKYGVKDLFAYNASFDKNLLSELASYRWFDIMKIAAYRQYNDKIPASIECCKTGKMKRNYGVEPMMQLLSGNHRYTEVHNALYDATDELEIMRMLGKTLEEYIVAEI